MNLEIFKSSYGYYNLRTNDGRPTEEMVNYLKENGYRWSPKNKCWYPATSDAKEANLHDDFVVKFREKFFESSEKSEESMVEKLVDHATDYVLEKQALKNLSDNIEEKIAKERTVKLEELIAELREQLRLQNEKIAQLENSNHKLAEELQGKNENEKSEKNIEVSNLKTYHTLKEDDVKNLEIVTDEEFSDIVDSIILNDYKNIPNVVRLPNLNAELSEKLGLKKDSAFILKKSATHIRPDRKGSYEQALDTEEYRMIPKVMRDATFALIDKRFDNFQILFDDVDDIKKINKLAFNKDELGNYLVTVGKIDRRDGISEKDNIVVGVGVAPTISALRYPKEPPATRLRPSPTTKDAVTVGVAPTIQTLKARVSSTALRASSTTVDLNISQTAEKSSSVQVEKNDSTIGKLQSLNYEQFQDIAFSKYNLPISDSIADTVIYTITSNDCNLYEKDGKFIIRAVDESSENDILLTVEDVLQQVQSTLEHWQEENNLSEHENERLNEIKEINKKIKLDNKNNEIPNLKTYHTLKEDEIKSLSEITQDEFNSIIDALYQQPNPDYKAIPPIIKLPQMNEKLAKKIGVENANFFMKSEVAHVRPQRKGSYAQSLRIDEMKGMLDFIKTCETAYIDSNVEHQNFILAGLDSQDATRSNKIVFNKDEYGNYIVTVGKVDTFNLEESRYSKVAVGVEPTIWMEFNAPSSATMLRPSTTSLDDLNIAQEEKKSSKVAQPEHRTKKQLTEIREKCREILEKLDNSYLNEKEKSYLENEIGEKDENDRNWVEATLRSAKFIYCTKKDKDGYWDEEHGKAITANEARKMLSMSDFVSALDRACFHWTSGRSVVGKDGKETGYIAFDDSDRDRTVPPYELTKEDLQILSQYEGAGGLNEANRSVNGVLNEFYTPQNLVDKVWEIVDHYAPEAKTVLEPSSGIGKFAVNRPQNEFTMHELDETSARINKILHPNANVIQGAYQKQFFDESERFRKTDFEQPKYDVVIGNPPYGKYNDKYKGLGEGKEFDRYEEYFIAKGLDALKDENSVLAFVVPSGFLKSAEDNQKKIIAEKGQIIDAYRLPEGTFGTTDVGTDIIVMRSWDEKKQKLNERAKNNAAYQKAEIESWTENEVFKLSGDQWFKNHPEKILGKTVEFTDRFGKPATKVVAEDGMTVQDELDKIDGFVAENEISDNRSREETAYVISFKETESSFLKSLDEYLDKGIAPKNNEFIIHRTPEILEKANVPQNEIMLTTGVINKAKNIHNLTNEEIKDAVISFADPLLIFDSDKDHSENKENSVLVITDRFAQNGKPIAFSLNMDVQRKGYEQRLEVNEIRSIHDRTVIAKNGVNILQEWTEKGLCRYADDKKIAQERLDSFQLPQATMNTILTKSKLVNSVERRNFGDDYVMSEKEFNNFANNIRHEEEEQEQKIAEPKTETPKSFLKNVDEIERAIPENYEPLKNLSMSERSFSTALWYIKDATEENKGMKFYGQIWQEKIEEIAHTHNVSTDEIIDVFYKSYQEINKSAYLKALATEKEIEEKTNEFVNEWKAEYAKTEKTADASNDIDNIVNSAKQNIESSRPLGKIKLISEEEQLKDYGIKAEARAKYFVKSTAEFEQFAEFEPITNLTCEEAVAKYKELQEKGVHCGIGINIEGDRVFDDKNGNGITVLLRNDEGRDTLNIYGDSFVKNLKERVQHSFDVLVAFDSLYRTAKDAGLDVEDAPYIAEKENELFGNLFSRNQIYDSYASKQATDFVLEKLKAAGIEVITDKDDFERRLDEINGTDIFQAMTEKFVETEISDENKTVPRATTEIKDAIKDALEKTATPLTEVVYSRENYQQIFKNGIIQSPIETIKMGQNQFVRLCPPDRNNLMGAIYETMTKPAIVLEKETFDEKSQSFKPVHVYGKSFINKKNNHTHSVESIIIFRDGENIAASLHFKGIQKFVNQIKTADDIIYINNEVSRLAAFSSRTGDSHVVKETQEFLSSAGRKSLPLINSSYNPNEILSIQDLIKQGKVEAGRLEITKENFDKYFNIFNQNTRVYKDNPNKIASDLLNFHVKAENRDEMKKWLEEQNYKISGKLHQFKILNGKIYGFTDGEKIYLNPDFLNSNVAVHEYTHLWDEYTRRTNPKLWQKGMNIFKDAKFFSEVKNDPNYADIANDDDLVLSEVHARICGKMAEKILERIAKEDGEITRDKAIDWDKEIDQYIYENFESSRTLNDGREIKSTGYGAFGLVVDVNAVRSWFAQPMKDLMAGKDISLHQNEAEKPQKSSQTIAKSKGEVMSAKEFSHLYGRNFDEREFSIWRATDWQGNIDLSKLSDVEKNLLHTSKNYVEIEPEKFTHRVLFESGDITAKIEDYKTKLTSLNNREEESKKIKLYEKNIEQLEKVACPKIPMERLHFGVNSTLAEEFTIEHKNSEGQTEKLNLQESFILWAKGTTYAEATDGYYWRNGIDFATANISREDLPENVSWYDIVEYIDKKSVKAERVNTWRKSEEEISTDKSQKRKEAEEKRMARSETADRLFDKYIHEGLSPEISAKIESEYNRRFNSYVIPDYSKLPLFIDGMSRKKDGEKFKLYDQQIKGVSFLCNKGNGLLAYDVGVGKTAAGIVATVNQIQTGRSKRPLIVVPNAVYAKWYKDIQDLFPNTKINDLYNLNKESSSKYRNSENPHKLDIPENSISLVTYEALKNITFTDKACENELFEDYSKLLSEDLDGNDRENAQSADKIKGIIGAASQVKNSNYVFFEDCGFDNITVDEAHNFKNLWTVPRPKNKGESNEFSGIPTGKPSARALKLFAMTQLTQRHNEDRNVFLLTATPFTNSPLEVYSMLSYVGRKRLVESGIYSLRDFCTEFAHTKLELGVNSKGEIDQKQVMKDWKELPALQKILTEFIDKVDGEELKEIIRPKKFTHVQEIEMSDLQKQMMQIDTEKMNDVKENSAAVIVSMNAMRIALVAPALADPSRYPELKIPSMQELVETSPKLKFVCDSVIDMYKNNPEKGQFIYMPLGQSAHGIVKDYLIAHGLPKESVEIINGSVNNTTDKKAKVTQKFNDPKNKCKILIGGKNTSEGIDLNGNSFVMYNCSLGWNPSETIQAEGRIWRQGNQQGHVHCVYPVMNDSIDSLLYQKHDEKRSRINEIWTYKDGDTLNVEDINPEELKFELIKDPQKRAKLILENGIDSPDFKFTGTKNIQNELNKVNSRIKSFEETYEKRKVLKDNIKSSEITIGNRLKNIEDYKSRTLEVPEWCKMQLKEDRKLKENFEHQLETINRKFESWGIKSDEDVENFIPKINAQKHSLEKELAEKQKELPKILERETLKMNEKKILLPSISEQRKQLTEDIEKNLCPMSEVEPEIRTVRFEQMLNSKWEKGEISQEEKDLYSSVGYKRYYEWLDGEIENLNEFADHKNETLIDEPKIEKTSSENSQIKNTEKTVVKSETVNKKQIEETFENGGLFSDQTLDELDKVNSMLVSKKNYFAKENFKETKLSEISNLVKQRLEEQNNSKNHIDSHISFVSLSKSKKTKVRQEAFER